MYYKLCKKDIQEKDRDERIEGVYSLNWDKLYVNNSIDVNYKLTIHAHIYALNKIDVKCPLK